MRVAISRADSPASTSSAVPVSDGTGCAASRARHKGGRSSGAVTASQAVLMGRRIPLPGFGPGWWAATAIAELQGAPLPPHARELIVRGCTADGTLATEVLGIEPRSTHDVVSQLYRWHTVAHEQPAPAASR